VGKDVPCERAGAACHLFQGHKSTDFGIQDRSPIFLAITLQDCIEETKMLSYRIGGLDY